MHVPPPDDVIVHRCHVIPRAAAQRPADNAAARVGGGYRRVCVPSDDATVVHDVDAAAGGGAWGGGGEVAAVLGAVVWQHRRVGDIAAVKKHLCIWRNVDNFTRLHSTFYEVEI